MKKLATAQVRAIEHTQDIVMVCVTRQRTCERLIARGKAIAAERNLPLHVVHAVRTGENFLGNAEEGDALEYLLTAAQLSGGELTVLRADDVEKSLEEYALAHGANVLVIGASPGGGGRKFVERIERRLPAIHVVVV